MSLNLIVSNVSDFFTKQFIYGEQIKEQCAVAIKVTFWAYLGFMASKMMSFGLKAFRNYVRDISSINSSRFGALEVLKYG